MAPTSSSTFENVNGNPLYIMGLSYYANISKTMENFRGLTKSNIVSLFGEGLSRLSLDVLRRLPTGTLNLQYPRLDMYFTRTAVAANSTLHADSGDSDVDGCYYFFKLLAGELSAQEQIRSMNFLVRKSSIYSKLLDGAQGTTPGSNVVILDKTNFSSAISQTYNQSGKTLSLWLKSDLSL
ncbi:MAG: hypothetical protein QM796_13130 [Chthoniobacteraceae bacterium]